MQLSDDLLFEYFLPYKNLIVFLSGPSFAKEIMEEQITLVTLAGISRDTLIKTSSMLKCSYFRALLSHDIKGVLLGGSLKNILAIAAGIIEGLGFNHNTRAAMITIGIQEMLKFGKVFNANPQTFYGLSGIGDLILTTTGELSRNKQFGLEVSKGERMPDDIINASSNVIEGYKTTKAIYLLAEKYHIDAPIFKGIYEVLYNQKDSKKVISRLMSLPVTF